MFEQREEPLTVKRRNPLGVIIVILLVIILILLSIIFSNKNKNQVNQTGEVATETTTTIVNTTTDETPDVVTEDPDLGSVNFNYQTLQSWDGLEKAEKYIQSLGQGQKISTGIVQDPTEENIVYFASNALNSSSQENFVSIYKYNVSDYTFDRLFKKNYAVDGFSEVDGLPIFNVIGYDNGLLVISVSAQTSASSPCPSLYLGSDDSHQIVSMEIAEPYSGFKIYSPPKQALDAEKTIIEKCEQEE